MPSQQRRLPRPSFPRFLSVSIKPIRTSDPSPSHNFDSYLDDSSSKSLDHSIRPASDSRAEKRRACRMPSKWRVEKLQNSAHSQTTTSLPIDLTHSTYRSDDLQSFISDDEENKHLESNIEQLSSSINHDVIVESPVITPQDEQIDQSECLCTKDIIKLQAMVSTELRELRRLHARTAEAAQENLRTAALLEARIDEMRMINTRQPSSTSVLLAMIFDTIATILLFFIRLLITKPYTFVVRLISAKPQINQDQQNRCSWRLSNNAFSDDQFLDSVAKRLSFSATDWNAKTE